MNNNYFVQLLIILPNYEQVRTAPNERGTFTQQPNRSYYVPLRHINGENVGDFEVCNSNLSKCDVL